MTFRGTACSKCKHFLNVSTGTDMDIWYNHYCKVSPRPLEFSHVSGKMERPKQEFEFCSVINRGDCPKFEAI